jgi:hypothetical protein
MTDQKPAEKTEAVAKCYEPSAREKAALAAFEAEASAKKPSPPLKVEKKGNDLAVTLNHPDLVTAFKLLSQALGTSNPDFLGGIVGQLANMTGQEKPDDAAINFALAMVTGIEPRDQLEAMLAAQMAAVHLATMAFARRLACVENIPQQDSAQNAFNKLARTFATQMDALKRYRSTGEQRVTVQHVTVNDGGQAIVGAVAGRPAGGGCGEE